MLKKITNRGDLITVFTMLYLAFFGFGNGVLALLNLRFRAWFSYLSVGIITAGFIICIISAIFRVTKSKIKYVFLVAFIIVLLLLGKTALFFVYLLLGTEKTAYVDEVKYSVRTVDFLDTDKYYYKYKNFLVSEGNVSIKEFYTTGSEPLYATYYDDNGNVIREECAPGG